MLKYDIFHKETGLYDMSSRDLSTVHNLLLEHVLVIVNVFNCFQLSKRHRNGHMAKVDWIDRLTYREIEMINEKQKRDSNFMYLMIEFSRIHFDATEFAIVYFEKVIGVDITLDHHKQGEFFVCF